MIFVEREFVCAQGVPEWCEAGFGCRASYSRLESRDQGEECCLMIVEIVELFAPRNGNGDHADGDEDVGLVSANGRIAVRRRDTENGEGVAIDENRLADNIARRAKMSSPEVVAEHRDWIGVLLCVVLLREKAAKRGIKAE